MVVGLIHQENPVREDGQRDQKPDQTHHHGEKSERHDTQNASHNRVRNPEHDKRHVKEYGLEGVEAHELIILVRLDHQKDNSGDKAQDVSK